MAPGLSSWLRGRVDFPVALCALPGELRGDAEWGRGGLPDAPAITLRMSPGSSARIAVDVGRPFTLGTTVCLAGATGPCTFDVAAHRGGREIARASMTVRPDDPQASLRVRVPSGRAVEVVLATSGDAGPLQALWGSPTLWVRRPWRQVGRGALAAIGSGRAASRVGDAVAGALGLAGDGRDDRRYARWMRRSRAASVPVTALEAGPRVSVVLAGPAAGESPGARRCRESVEAHGYPQLEIVRAARPIDGLRRATGELVVMISDPGLLGAGALWRAAAALVRDPAADVVYSDEDRLDGGRRRHPFFKPDWSPEYQLSRLYVGQLVVYRKAVLGEIDGLREDGSAATDLFLRAIERTSRVAHLPEVLWHWLDDVPSAAAGALGDHVARRHPGAAVAPGPRPGCYRIRWRIDGAPLVTVIIPTRDRLPLLRRCLASLAATTDDVRHEVVIVDHDSVEPDTRDFLAGCGHRVVPAQGPFNFARLNNLGAGHARGEHLLFLNNDTEAIEPGWLGALVELSQQEAIGAVGAKLHYPDGRLQHAGMVLGLGRGVAQPFRGAPGDHPGYFDSSAVVRNWSAVTGACLLTRRAVFDAAGGFDEAFAADYNDVDYCLRLRAMGYRVAVTPHARLWHHEFATRPRRVSRREHALFRARWSGAIARDPYFSPNLSRRHLDLRVGP